MDSDIKVIKMLLCVSMLTLKIEEKLGELSKSKGLTRSRCQCECACVLPLCIFHYKNTGIVEKLCIFP